MTNTRHLQEASCKLPFVAIVKLLSRVWLFVTPAARQTSLSLTISWSLPKVTSIESVMPSNHLILCHLLLCYCYQAVKLAGFCDTLLYWNHNACFISPHSPTHQSWDNHVVWVLNRLTEINMASAMEKPYSASHVDSWLPLSLVNKSTINQISFRKSSGINKLFLLWAASLFNNFFNFKISHLPKKKKTQTNHPDFPIVNIVPHLLSHSLCVYVSVSVCVYPHTCKLFF